jgi:LmbE family N-acetylglucosaminyl deacetylase
MKFRAEGAELFIPDGLAEEEALSRTTHACFGAHQDDVEIMAARGIIDCFGHANRWFLGVTVTDGSGSPRNGLYGRYTDEEMRCVRRREQKKAAVVGEYGAMALLDFPSAAVKDTRGRDVVDDIHLLLEAARPEVVYTHNLADKHDTHVAVALRVIQALRALPPASRPKAFYGCEVWRDLDWLLDADKVTFDVSAHENLSAALVGVFDSQIAGGKRYDLATLGRRRAHATYLASHGTDQAQALTLAMDLSPLLEKPELDPGAFALEHIRRFQDDVATRVRKYAQGAI